jgi:hypothetical protein
MVNINKREPGSPGTGTTRLLFRLMLEGKDVVLAKEGNPPLACTR